MADWVDLTKSAERLPFCLVTAAIAKAKILKNGGLGLGAAIAACYDEGNKSNQAKSKLRRLLACDSTEELCSVLRSLLRLIESKSAHDLDYARLLDDLLKFHKDGQKIKAKWAENFYNHSEEKEVMP